MSLKRTLTLLGLAAACLLLIAPPAWAEDGSTFGQIWRLGWRIINFLILAVVLYKVASKPAKEFFRGKRQEAKEVLADLEEAKAKAEAELAQLKAKLDSADQEISEVVEQLGQVAARKREKIIEEAGLRAEEILAQAKRAAESELQRAKQALTIETSRGVIARAAQMLKERLTPDDHLRLINQVLDRMEVARPA